jgi:AraC family transcriptional regulator
MKPSTEQDYRERIVRTLQYIQQHLDDDDLQLEQAASVAAFSKFHFHRVFRGMVGETLSEHVRRLRLERAAGHLKRLDLPITQIAFDAGFEAHESFTRAFGDMFGMSPSEYRAAHRPVPPSRSGVHFDDIAGYHRPDYGDLLTLEVKQLPPTQVLFLGHVGPYDQVGATWGKLMSWAGMRGLLGADMKLIGIAHDDPDVTPAGRLRYDAAVTVSRPVTPEGEFAVVEIDGGSYAIATHKGPYHDLAKTYQRVYGGWLPQSGYEPRDAPSFEQYLNSPQNTQPEDLLTVIHVPVG